jgi:glycine/D-amino acid oxidase-like deaminating enzyme
MFATVSRSLWSDTVAFADIDRPKLTQNIEVDVAIIGAGFTGLWTAYYLKQLAPNLSIVVVDANHVGFGASGRNGGWCSALFPASFNKLAKLFGEAQAKRMHAAMVGNINEIARVIELENIDCEWAHGGTVIAARSQIQLQRAKDEVKEHSANGLPASDLEFLSADEIASHANFSDAIGGTFTPNCAALNPAKLVHALARIVEKLGVQIYENSPVSQITKNKVTLENADIKAKFIVRATEGYSPTIKQARRVVVPVYSLMIATEPLPDSFWQQTGLANRQTFSDFRNLVIYGQRTADNRIAFGGRGAPYHFGSSIKPENDHVPEVHNLLEQTLLELFPDVAGAKITHSWGGALGIARDWMASCGLDSQTGLAWAGGYVGDGVSTSNLAGRTLADLITGNSSELTTLPWVNHSSRNWEPEPLRWLGINSGLIAVKHADAVEANKGRTSKVNSLLGRFIGE